MGKFQLKSMLILLSLACSIAQAQTDTSYTADPSDKECAPRDISDLIRKKGKPQKPPRKTSVLVLPNISSNPTNGFMLGIGGGFGWYMGPKENTKVSSANFSAAVTSKDQLITFVKPNIYTNENKYFFQG